MENKIMDNVRLICENETNFSFKEDIKKYDVFVNGEKTNMVFESNVGNLDENAIEFIEYNELELFEDFDEYKYHFFHFDPCSASALCIWSAVGLEKMHSKTYSTNDLLEMLF